MISPSLRWVLLVGLGACLLSVFPVVHGSAAQRVRLAETASNTRVLRVTGTASAAGSTQAPETSGKAISLKSQVDAKWEFLQRRLASTGRDGEALRAIRRYVTADAKITVAEQVTVPRLRPELRWIVAEGQGDGIRYFSPQGPLTAGELELLDTPIDDLALLALLPDDPVEPGDKWKPSSWVMQFLSGVEAVEKSELNCEVQSLDTNSARVKFNGSISGGIVGAHTEITISGSYRFDLKQQLLTDAEVILKEKRSISPVTTGIDLSSQITVARRVVDDAQLPAAETDRLETVPSPERLLVLGEAPGWNLRWAHHRHWYVFHQTDKVAVMRLLDRGSLLCQCNIAPIAPAKPGEHMDEKQFQADVQKAIGTDFRKIVQAEIVDSKDKRYIYRVIASGETQQPVEGGKTKVTPLEWIYYLITSPTGQQIVLVFTLEPTQRERFQTQDLDLALGTNFISTALGAPTPLK